MAGREQLVKFARRMPKAELHVHLEGTLEPKLAEALAKRNNVALNLPPPTADGAYPFHDLTSFLAVYYGAMSVLISEQDFEELMYAYLDKADSQNVRHVEMFFDPQAHASKGVSIQTIVTGLRRAIVRARDERGISAWLIMCFLRDKSAESAMETLTEALALPQELKDVILGVGLDSDEKGNPPLKFKDVYERVRKEAPQWRLTMHCDPDQENSIEHIRQALNEIGVNRIDHGTNAVEDPEVVQTLKQRGIGLTSCPLSNKVLCSTFKKDEILSLLRAGVLITANSDDPAFFRGYVNESLDLLVSESDITRDEIVKLQENAFSISWVNEETHRLFEHELRRYVEKAK